MAIFTHVCVGASDLEKSREFYDAALAPLGINNLGAFGENGYLYGVDAPEFLILKPANGEPACHANGGTIGFAAETRAKVHDFHAGGMGAGGTCEGEPGPRTFTPTAYAAYLRDPDGNKITSYCFADEG